MSEMVDILVIGGGINGAGIARDAAGRGLSVVLCEQGDLAGATSSSSTKMIHGGLRYLEYFELSLVREALAERERLLHIAPHLVRPLRLILPHDAAMRPAWMIRSGLWLYDRLGGGSSLPRSGAVRLENCIEAEALRHPKGRAFAYSDGWSDDARLVAISALDAHERGAAIHTRTRVTACIRKAGLWLVRTKTKAGKSLTFHARALVNAAGPWVEHMDEDTQARAVTHMRLVKGSHIVLPRLFEGECGFLLQNPDRRVLFALPWLGQFTLFGTTDTPFTGNPCDARLDEGERAYLLEAVNRFFAKTTTAEDILWTYSGVRALFGDEEMDASKLSREYHLDLTGPGDGAPVLTVLGGKITTFRALAEKAIDMLAPRLGNSAAHWTGTSPLPGGDLPDGSLDAWRAQSAARWPFLPAPMLRRLTRLYGTRLEQILGTARSLDELGKCWGAGLHEAELEYLKAREWAQSADDVLWRRTKLGLFMSPKQQKALAKAF